MERKILVPGEFIVVRNTGIASLWIRDPSDVTTEVLDGSFHIPILNPSHKMLVIKSNDAGNYALVLLNGILGYVAADLVERVR